MLLESMKAFSLIGVNLGKVVKLQKDYELCKKVKAKIPLGNISI